MTTMTDDEIFDSTVVPVHEWFYTDSGILESCLKKENEQIEIYGDIGVMCPFYVAFLELAGANIHKGWTSEELIHNMKDVFGYDDE